MSDCPLPGRSLLEVASRAILAVSLPGSSLGQGAGHRHCSAARVNGCPEVPLRHSQWAAREDDQSTGHDPLRVPQRWSVHKVLCRGFEPLLPL